MSVRIVVPAGVFASDDDELRRRREVLAEMLRSGKAIHIDSHSQLRESNNGDDYRKIIFPANTDVSKLGRYLYGYENDGDYYVQGHSDNYVGADNVIGVFIEGIWEITRDVLARNDNALLKTITREVCNIEKVREKWTSIVRNSDNGTKYYKYMHDGIRIPEGKLGDSGPVGNSLRNNGGLSFLPDYEKGVLVGFNKSDGVHFIEIKCNGYWDFVELQLEY